MLARVSLERAAVNGMEERCFFFEEDETEAEAARHAMLLPDWTLNQTLAWIATRKPEAVGRDKGELGVSVWMVFQKIAGRPIDFPLRNSGDAWRNLAMALAQKKLSGFAAQVLMTRSTGIVQHFLGQPFPPEGQPGFALQCSVFDGDRSVVAPTNRMMAVSWTEFHDLTFSREDVVRLWPAQPVLDVEAKSLSTMEAVELSDSQKKPSRRGRPTFYPWSDFGAEALRKLEDEGGVGAVTNFSQADLEKHMTDWCMSNWEQCPTESTVRKKVAEARGAYEANKGR